MRISDWSSDVCSSDLVRHTLAALVLRHQHHRREQQRDRARGQYRLAHTQIRKRQVIQQPRRLVGTGRRHRDVDRTSRQRLRLLEAQVADIGGNGLRSEEHTYELQSLMRISYAVFRLKKNIKN